MSKNIPDDWYISGNTFYNRMTRSGITGYTNDMCSDRWTNPGMSSMCDCVVWSYILSQDQRIDCLVRIVNGVRFNNPAHSEACAKLCLYLNAGAASRHTKKSPWKLLRTVWHDCQHIFDPSTCLAVAPPDYSNSVVVNDVMDLMFKVVKNRSSVPQPWILGRCSVSITIDPTSLYGRWAVAWDMLVESGASLSTHSVSMLDMARAKDLRHHTIMHECNMPFNFAIIFITLPITYRALIRDILNMPCLDAWLPQ